MREQLNVKQRQAISETPAKGGGGLVEACFSSLGRMVAFPGKRPWLGCCLQANALTEPDYRRSSCSGRDIYWLCPHYASLPDSICQKPGNEIAPAPATNSRSVEVLVNRS
jgi:hypothetical protein